jgi:hypothetical protein
MFTTELLSILPSWTAMDFSTWLEQLIILKSKQSKQHN